MEMIPAYKDNSALEDARDGLETSVNDEKCCWTGGNGIHRPFSKVTHQALPGLLNAMLRLGTLYTGTATV